MRGMTTMMVMGTVGNSPELKTSASGVVWTRVSVAVNRYDRTKEAEVTDWFDVRMFGRNAERAHKLLQPGAVISVGGQLELDRWTDDDGQEHRTVRLAAERFEIAMFSRRPEERPPAVAVA